MNYYRLTYTINANHERVYPRAFAGVVCRITQDHVTERFMIVGTDSRLAADGQAIVELTQDQALAQMEELKQGFPAPSPHDPSLGGPGVGMGGPPGPGGAGAPVPPAAPVVRAAVRNATSARDKQK